MATVKNYGLAGIGEEVQFGKGGTHLVHDSGEFKLFANTAATGAPDTGTLVNIHGADPTVLTHLTTKNYVDNVAAGLDPKESCRVATSANIDLSTGGLLTIDGVTVALDDRVLVKDQSDPAENGIYLAKSGSWIRSEDMDGTPANEISSGTFTFVEEGDTYANTGWVLTGLGILSLSDDKNFVQFSGAGATTLTGGTGITVTQNGTDWTVDANTSGVSTGISVSDNIIVRSTGTAGQLLRSVGTDGAEATWGALNLDLDGVSVTGQLGLAHGGTNTNTSTWTNGSLMLMDGVDSVTQLLAGASGTVLKGQGAGVDPIYAALDLAADVGTSILPVANGGTSRATLTDGAILLGAGTSPIEFLPSASDTTQVVMSGAGSTDNPTFGWLDSLYDASSGELIISGEATGADSNFHIDATGSGVLVLEAQGTGSDVDIQITPKGAGQVDIDGLTYPKASAVTDDAEGAFLNLIADGGTELQLSFPSWVTDDINSGFQSWGGSGSYWTTTGTGGSFTVDRPGTGYVRSRKVAWVGGQSVTLTPNFTNWIYMDDNGVIGVATAATANLYEDNIVLFEVLDDGANVTVVRENHPFNFDTQVSGYMHRVVGTIITGTNGDIGGDISIGDNTGGATKIGISGGAFVEDHGLRDTIQAVAGATGIDWNVYYTNGSGNWIRQGSPKKHLSAYWDNAGVPTLTNNFAVFGLYVSKTDLESSGDVKFFAIMDDSDYANVGAAQTAINDGTIRVPTAELYSMELTRIGYAIMDGEGTGTDDDTIESLVISKEVLGSQTVSGGGGGTAASINTNTTNFDNILSGADTTVQLALDTIDDHLIDDHNGVDTAGKSTGSLLQWSGTEWVDVLPAALGVGSYSTITADSGSASTTVGNETLNFTGGEGITTSVSDGSPDTVTIELALSELPVDIIDVADSLAFVDASAANADKKTTVTSFVNNLDLVRATFGSGMIAKTADDTYAGRTITASAGAGDEGISIVNGNGVAGNPTVGLDITGLTSESTVDGTDELVIFDGANNVKTTVADLLASSANDVSRINDVADTTYLDTDEVAGTVVGFASGDQVLSLETAGSADTYLTVKAGSGEVEIHATSSNTNADLRLTPQGSGQVLIGDSGPGVIKADDDEMLTVKGGDENSTAGGDLVLEGGDGSTGADGSVYIQPGTGGAVDGQVCIRDGDDGLITCFVGGAGTPDTSMVVTSGTGDVTISSTGAANADIVLDPAGTGLVVAPSGYDMSSGTPEAFATKEYVDSQAASAVDDLTMRGNLSVAGGAIETMPSVAGKTYIVDRILIKVATTSGTFTSGGTVAGGQTYVTFADVDYNVPGTYIVDANDLGDNNESGNAFTISALVGGATMTGKIVIHYKAAN